MVSPFSWVLHHGEARPVPGQARGAIAPRLWLDAGLMRQG